WTISSWEIIPIQIKLEWVYKTINLDGGISYRVLVLSDNRGAGITYEYYDFSNGEKGDGPFAEDEIEYSATQRKSYKGYPVLDVTDRGNYEFVKKDGSDITGDNDLYSDPFSIGGGATEITVSLASNSYVYTGKPVVLRFPSGTPTGSLTFTYYEGDAGVNKIDSAPTTVGTYWVEVASNNSSVVLSGETKFQFTITKSIISTEWNTTAKPPVLRNLTSIQLQQGIEYEYYDADMHKVEYSDLNKGGTFYIRAVLKDNVNFEFDNGEVETETKEFTVTPGEELRDPSDINNPNYDFEEDPNLPGDPTEPTDPTEPGDKDGNVNLGKVKEFLEQYWQPIVTAISILLILIFTGKGLGYASKRKKAKKTIEKKYSTYYAIAGTGLFGLPNMTWTIVASIMAGVAVLSFIFMLLEKRSYGKAEEELEEAKEEYARNEAKHRDDEMQMMFMRMMGGNANGGGAQGGYAYAQQPMLGAEEMRGMISEVVTALLPGVQQMLPQQASTNNELVEKLLEKTTKNEEAMQKLIKKVAEQPAEKIVEREVAATSVSEEVLDRLANKLQPATTDDTIKRILDNQEKLMEKILELSANQQTSEPQVIEKIVEIPAEKPAPKAKAAAPRLTLDEAYEKLSAKQKKFFDTLKAYALSKDKCKEKKSTYYILLGQS
ncbi:MAG: hypothetical protein K2O95_05375, partial [Clostridia bacterium]|nr:hypothetical protein [Clostridia bacterium]